MLKGEPSRRDLWIALNAETELSRAAVCRLAASLDAWRGEAPGSASRLAGELGVPAPAIERALALAPAAAAIARREERAAERAGARLVTLEEAEYPAPLLELALPPPALYLAGEIPAGPAIAIVGARQASGYGLEVAAWFARELAQAGVVVVSGFAVGVDGAAHRGALAAEGGMTVAVLGCGLDVDYPKPHRALRGPIARRGALVSEFPCALRPDRWRFPIRNRLIAALAAAVVVVEAAPRSGSLVTARLALDLGREVLAVPGRVTDELAVGTNALLADGAEPAISPRDLLERLARGGAPSGRAPVEPAGLAAAALALWRASAADRGAAPEELAAAAGLPIDAALGWMLELELAGHLRRLPGGLLVRGRG
jgi:DNA processing protein